MVIKYRVFFRFAFLLPRETISSTVPKISLFRLSSIRRLLFFSGYYLKFCEQKLVIVFCSKGKV